MDTGKMACIDRYISALKDIYGKCMRTVILYGSYTRGDYTEQSDIDIMLLVDIPEASINKFFVQSSDMTYDFNCIKRYLEKRLYEK